MIITSKWVKIAHFRFIPSKYEYHKQVMILENMRFILNSYRYYTSVFAMPVSASLSKATPLPCL